MSKLVPLLIGMNILLWMILFYNSKPTSEDQLNSAQQAQINHLQQQVSKLLQQQSQLDQLKKQVQSSHYCK